MVLNKLSKMAKAELLKDLQNTDDVTQLVEVADAFDRKGCIKAADHIDDLLIKIAKKQQQPGRSYVQWLRHLKKCNCPVKTVDKFKVAYKDELKRCKDRGFNDPEKKALKKSCKGLPKKYMR